MMWDANQLESAVSGLPAAELAKFRRWFADFDAEAWDRQFEVDAHAGRLDALAQAALADHQTKQTTPRRDQRR